MSHKHKRPFWLASKGTIGAILMGSGAGLMRPLRNSIAALVIVCGVTLLIHYYSKDSK